jgi:dephospho-CoA kinase
MKKQHIGLIGLAGAGKDTAARALLERGWQCVGFADAIKTKAYFLGWDGLKDERGRRLLQDIGMAMRRFDENFWIHKAQNSMKGGPCVFTDVRFANEADFIRAEGGIIVRVVREGLEIGEHESEAGQLAIRSDQSILNDGTIEHLHAHLLEIAKGNL